MFRIYLPFRKTLGRSDRINKKFSYYFKNLKNPINLGKFAFVFPSAVFGIEVSFVLHPLSVFGLPSSGLRFFCPNLIRLTIYPSNHSADFRSRTSVFCLIAFHLPILMASKLVINVTFCQCWQKNTYLFRRQLHILFCKAVCCSLIFWFIGVTG